MLFFSTFVYYYILCSLEGKKNGCSLLDAICSKCAISCLKLRRPFFFTNVWQALIEESKKPFMYWVGNLKPQFRWEERIQLSFSFANHFIRYFHDKSDCELWTSISLWARWARLKSFPFALEGIITPFPPLLFSPSLSFSLSYSYIFVEHSLRC